MHATIAPIGFRPDHESQYANSIAFALPLSLHNAIFNLKIFIAVSVHIKINNTRCKSIEISTGTQMLYFSKLFKFCFKHYRNFCKIDNKYDEIYINYNYY